MQIYVSRVSVKLRFRRRGESECHGEYAHQGYRHRFDDVIAVLVRQSAFHLTPTGCELGTESQRGRLVSVMRKAFGAANATVKVNGVQPALSKSLEHVQERPQTMFPTS